MTSEEIKMKLDASNEKVEKRLSTIKKLCAKENIDYNVLLDEYDGVVDYKQSSFKSKDAKALVERIAKREIEGYGDTLGQLADNMSKLFDVEKIANNWQIKYDTQFNKENKTRIGVIWDFLTNWENNAREWYIKNADYLVEKMNEFHDVAYKFFEANKIEDVKFNERTVFIGDYNNYIKSNFPKIKSRYHYSDFAIDAEDYIDSVGIDKLTKKLSEIKFVAESDAPYNSLGFYNELRKGHYELKNFDIDKLNKILAQDKINKYDDLCDRISDVVGEITNASGLSLGHQSGEINGIVEGTNGKAKVETIGAGGYNIQVFHFRVLVHKVNIKEK